MSVQDWSTTPDSNTTIDGVNIAEGAPAGNMNNALRRVMASVRVLYNNLPSGTGFLALAGGTMTGAILRSGAGAHLYNADSSASSGRVFTIVAGGSMPQMANGDQLWTLE